MTTRSQVSKASHLIQHTATLLPIARFLLVGPSLRYNQETIIEGRDGLMEAGAYDRTNPLRYNQATMRLKWANGAEGSLLESHTVLSKLRGYGGVTHIICYDTPHWVHFRDSYEDLHWMNERNETGNLIVLV